MFGRAVLLKLAASPRAERIVKGSRLWRPLVRRFVAGDEITDLIEPVRAMNEAGMTAAISYLGENVRDSAQALEAVDRYRELARFLAEQDLNAYLSVKLTQLGLDVSDEAAVANLSSVVEEAARNGLYVRADMEGSSYVQRTLDAVCKVHSEHKNVGVAIQAYLHRSASDVEELIESRTGVRLVKGAYREPASIAIQEMESIRATFISLARELLARSERTALATHDEGLIVRCQQAASQQGIAPERYEFQMLYGVRRDLQRSLREQGHGMRVYVPFGTQWYPYMMRRLAERPGNLWFLVKSLFRP